MRSKQVGGMLKVYYKRIGSNGQEAIPKKQLQQLENRSQVRETNTYV